MIPHPCRQNFLVFSSMWQRVPESMVLWICGISSGVFLQAAASHWSAGRLLQAVHPVAGAHRHPPRDASKIYQTHATAAAPLFRRSAFHRLGRDGQRHGRFRRLRALRRGARVVAAQMAQAAQRHTQRRHLPARFHRAGSEAFLQVFHRILSIAVPAARPGTCGHICEDSKNNATGSWM